MLTTQVAARSKEVAFIIDSSGFMGPLWQTLRYQTDLRLRTEGLSQADADRAVALTDTRRGGLRAPQNILPMRRFVVSADFAQARTNRLRRPPLPPHARGAHA
jgi:hypothetical protein